MTSLYELILYCRIGTGYHHLHHLLIIIQSYMNFLLYRIQYHLYNRSQGIRGERRERLQDHVICTKNFHFFFSYKIVQRELLLQLFWFLFTYKKHQKAFLKEEKEKLSVIQTNPFSFFFFYQFFFKRSENVQEKLKNLTILSRVNSLFFFFSFLIC